MATETNSPTATLDPDERIVEEVHCIYTGAPIPAIPSWYANVNVRFFCEAAKAKSPALAAAINPLDAPSAASDNDSDVEPALDDIDDAELELDDAEIDADDAAAEDAVTEE